MVLSAKKVLQDLRRKEFGWDDTAPAAQEWRSWMQELCILKDFEVDRCLQPVEFGEAAAAQLHHFADASEDCYGRVTCLLLHNHHHQMHCVSCNGKVKSCPVKANHHPLYDADSSQSL